MDQLVERDGPGHCLDLVQVESCVADDFEEEKTYEVGPLLQLVDTQLLFF